jgi:hypothetical protein
MPYGQLEITLIPNSRKYNKYAFWSVSSGLLIDIFTTLRLWYNRKMDFKNILLLVEDKVL